MDEARSESGESVPLASEDWALIGAVSSHFEKHIGVAERIWHETFSPLVHVDVHIIEPAEGRPFVTLFTTGMAQLPMNAPPGMPVYAELMMRLPPWWKIGDEHLKKREWGWPIVLLQDIARYPHAFGRLVFLSNTLAFSEPPEPLHPSVGFTCVLIGLPEIAMPDIHLLPCGNDRRGLLYSVIPIFTEELNIARRDGGAALIGLLRRHGINDIVDPKRRNIAKKRFGLF